MKIINPLINSARPQINNMLQQGMELNLTAIAPLKNLNVTGLVGEIFLDYASVGLKFDLEKWWFIYILSLGFFFGGP